MTVTNISSSANGVSKAQKKLSVQPGARGERRCFCQGEVIMMLAHYGWIKSLDEDVDLPEAFWTEGRICVHTKDVVDGASLMQGDHVSFYLYVDDQGLGAEACQVTQPGSLAAMGDPEAIDVLGWSKLGSRLASSLKLVFEEELELLEEEAKLLDSPSDDDSTSVGTTSDSDGVDVELWGEVASGIGAKLAGLSDDDSCTDGGEDVIDVLPWRTAGSMLATSLKGVFEEELKLLEPPSDDASTSAETTSDNDVDSDCASDAVPWHTAGRMLATSLKSVFEEELKSLETPSSEAVDVAAWGDVATRFSRALQDDDAASDAEDSEAVNVASWADVASRFGRALQDDDEAVDVAQWNDVANRFATALRSLDIDDSDDGASEACAEDFSGIDGDLESNDGGDNASICSAEDGFSDASTGIGQASDAEDNVVKPWACVAIRPPPGLSLPFL